MPMKHSVPLQRLFWLANFFLVLRDDDGHVWAFSPNSLSYRRPSTLTFLPDPRSLRIPEARTISSSWVSTLAMTADDDDEETNNRPSQESRRARLRRRVSKLARDIINTASPDAVMAVLSDATAKAVDMAVEDLTARRSRRGSKESRDLKANIDPSVFVDEAFRPVEETLREMEESLHKARQALSKAKTQTREALKTIQTSSMAKALEGAVDALERAEKVDSHEVLTNLYVSSVDKTTFANVSSLTFEDVDYATSEMAPPFLDEDQCLVPGEPVVRVEKAPENSRRIFAGIDIMASVDEVWEVLTDYSHLQDVVPNLVVNEVLAEYPPAAQVTVDPNLPEELQCEQMSKQMKGSLLRQVGGAKIAGIQFSARTTLEVREWPNGLPDFAHFRQEVWEGKSRKERAISYTKIPLQRYKFPRPFAVSRLPTRDISMQSIPDDDGEFRMYQGVWRMQPLPGCSPPGSNAMRLTYAVQVSPRAYLPVQLVEGRIVRDLCTNLIAIRDFLDARRKSKNALNGETN